MIIYAEMCDETAKSQQYAQLNNSIKDQEDDDHDNDNYDIVDDDTHVTVQNTCLTYCEKIRLASHNLFSTCDSNSGQERSVLGVLTAVNWQEAL